MEACQHKIIFLYAYKKIKDDSDSFPLPIERACPNYKTVLFIIAMFLTVFK